MLNTIWLKYYEVLRRDEPLVLIVNSYFRRGLSIYV
jgi:hypothetical protein